MLERLTLASWIRRWWCLMQQLQKRVVNVIECVRTHTTGLVSSRRRRVWAGQKRVSVLVEWSVSRWRGLDYARIWMTTRYGGGNVERQLGSNVLYGRGFASNGEGWFQMTRLS